jgi:hypothetical protein
MALEGTVEKGVFTNPNKFVLMLSCIIRNIQILKEILSALKTTGKKMAFIINEEKTRYAYMTMSPAQVHRYLHGIIIR